MSFIDQYERQLVEAATRRRDARLTHRARRWLGVSRGRRGAAAVLAALIVAVPATATIAEWNPFDDPARDPRFGAPTLSDRPVDAALVRRLGVLRRPQTDADRGAVTLERMRMVDASYRGAQLQGVRLVDREREIVLAPFELQPVPRDPNGRPLPGFDRPDFANVVCVLRRGGSSCHSAEKIERGQAISSDGGEVDGVVPDGVARVRLTRADETVEAPVRSNYFHATTPFPRTVEWLSADGSAIRRFDLGETP